MAVPLMLGGAGLNSTYQNVADSIKHHQSYNVNMSQANDAKSNAEKEKSTISSINSQWAKHGKGTISLSPEDQEELRRRETSAQTAYANYTLDQEANEDEAKEDRDKKLKSQTAAI